MDYSLPPAIIEQAKLSWYASGRYANGTPYKGDRMTAACWNEYAKGTKFKITYKGKSIMVVCDDRGNFKKLGRFLDLSKLAFSKLADPRLGIIRGAKVEVL